MSSMTSLDGFFIIPQPYNFSPDDCEFYEKIAAKNSKYSIR